MVQEFTSVRTATSIGIEWQPGTQDGGSEVIDYRITYVTGLTTTVVENVLASPYLAENLVTGSNYMFQIEARNKFSYSAPSNSVYIFCAFVPEKLTTIVTSVSNDVVVVSWTAPDANGASITAYYVEIQQKDSMFSENTEYCDGT